MQNPYGQSGAQQAYAQPAGYSGQTGYGQQSYNYNNWQQTEKKSMHPLTLWTLILAGAGFLLGIVNGIGLPLSIAAIVTGALAMRKDKPNRLWAIIGLAVGVIGTIMSIILWIITIMILTG